MYGAQADCNAGAVLKAGFRHQKSNILFSLFSLPTLLVPSPPFQFDYSVIILIRFIRIIITSII